MEPFQIAFGQDFDLGIEIPEYFEDISWKNDACPSFSLSPMDGVTIILWVDYADPEERECGGERYTVQQMLDDQFDRCLFETENPETILNYLTSETGPRKLNLRDKLREPISYDEGLKIRSELHKKALKTYIPKYSNALYFAFMDNNACTFRVNGAQSTNHPYYLTLFTEVSQHVMGDCVKECLDKAIEISFSKEIKP